MQPSTNPQADPFASLRGNLNILLLLCRTWATSLEVFLHRDVGERYLGFQAVAVLLLVPIYALFWEGYDIRLLLWFIPAYLLRCFVLRMEMLARRKRGETGHSFYNGRPTLMGPKAKFTELTCKRFLEPLLVLVLGWILRDLHEYPLGTYLMWGAVCLFVSVNTSVAYGRAQTLNMNDAVIEQEIVAERFRDLRGES